MISSGRSLSRVAPLLFGIVPRGVQSAEKTQKQTLVHPRLTPSETRNLKSSREAIKLIESLALALINVTITVIRASTHDLRTE